MVSTGNPSDHRACPGCLARDQQLRALARQIARKDEEIAQLIRPCDAMALEEVRRLQGIFGMFHAGEAHRLSDPLLMAIRASLRRLAELLART